MPSPADTSDSLEPACRAAQIIESIEKLREEMNMSPETSKLASRLRNQASAAVARGQGHLDNGDNIELA
ncbi:uncharacterized protein TrAtP1_010195 [Trichoderma atroviride]|uniref:uncharacterized protein n=1 Tax=Hypocrea atroviridis TaxID=63577 RepID=UPI00331F16AA|nr:hypothetical protein TrAtP1_010195 [Trichoderma atroviride]